MTEVQDELDRAVLFDGVAVVDEGMVLRDTWERYKAGGAALMANLEPPPSAYLAALEEATDPARSHFATVSLPRLLLGPTPDEPARIVAVDAPRPTLVARATPARARKPLRIRLCPDLPGGPHWLTLLAQCAWLRGGIIGERVVPQPTS